MQLFFAAHAIFLVSTCFSGCWFHLSAVVVFVILSGFFCHCHSALILVVAICGCSFHHDMLLLLWLWDCWLCWLSCSILWCNGNDCDAMCQVVSYHFCYIDISMSSLLLEDRVMLASLLSGDELMRLKWVDGAVINKLIRA